MKLGVKVFLVAAIGLLAVIISTYILSSESTMEFIRNKEKSNIQESYRNAALAIDAEGRAVRRTLLDWSHWDETYRFLKDQNQTYVDENLGAATIKQLGLYYMGFYDNGFRLIREDYGEEPVLGDISVLLEKWLGSAVFLPDANGYRSKTGLTYIGGSLLLVSAAPVTTSNGSAPEDGYMVLIKRLDSGFISYLEKLLNAGISLEGGKEGSAGVLSEMSFSADDIGVKRNDTVIEARSAVRDTLNAKPILFHLQMDRSLFKNAEKTFNDVLILCLVVFVMIMILCLFAFDRGVIRRIENLGSFVNSVIGSRDATLRYKVQGRDEISRLSANINTLLFNLHETCVETIENDKRLKLIMEATNDGFFDIDVPSGMIYFNSQWLSHLGYDSKRNHISMEECFANTLPDSRKELEEAYLNYLDGKIDRLEIEVKTYKAGGGWIWALIRGKVVAFDAAEKPTRLIGAISDITPRKKAEEENIYLLQTDTVTGLKNRSFMEGLLKNEEEYFKMGTCIIMADLNGLKLVNDTFGHKEGDRMLSVTGDVFRICCAQTDISVRWGGDEFLILVPEGGTQYTESLMQKIRNECASIDSFPLKLSISMGYAARDEKNPTIGDVIRVAEERMYRNKIMEGRSIRNATISSLEQLLYEKNTGIEAHIRRIREMCRQLGRTAGLTQEEQDELGLLCMFHDIGKISIPESLITKPGPLTEEEWDVMKSHSEIGYRIAKATPDLSHIAGCILAHHEFYNGGGYPRGLAGEKIPKTVRLFAVIDAFDAMTHSRVYRKEMSREEGIREILDRAGTQFDPEMATVFAEYMSTRLSHAEN